MYPDNQIIISGIPGYKEIIANSLGTYLHNPQEARKIMFTTISYEGVGYVI